MRKLLALMAFLAAVAVSLPAAADHLDGVLPLVRDDIAAVAKLKTTPERHVMLFFGDQAN